VSERGQRRRRLREQRRLREALLLDLGALVYELHRQGRRAPELLQQKAAELTVVDEEVRELEAELDGIEASAAPEPTDETAEVDAVSDEEPPEHELAEEDELEDEDGPEDAVTEDEEGFAEQEGTLADHQDEDAPEDEHDESLAEHEEPRA
jgi:hypothetical protein